MITSKLENQISKDKNILIILNKDVERHTELQYLMDHFCGSVTNHLSEIKNIQSDIKIYACGDFSNIEISDVEFNIIKDLSLNYENFLSQKTQLISLGEVPIIISNAGVYFRNLFPENDYFNKIKSEHEFQYLTESTKDSKAFRTGIYLTEILKETENNTEVFNFHLLRCSSNFTGPTDNFRETDHFIIHKLNECVKYVFEKDVKLNHVLAQIYENTQKTEHSQKEIKAKAVKVVVKEIRFGPNTDDHDYQFKLRHAEKFLEEGSKIKAYVFFKGRSILFKEQGEILLLRFANDLEEVAKVDQLPKLEGKRMIIMLSPKPKK